jgi:magnesium-transporting ATPase (P-type)
VFGRIAKLTNEPKKGLTTLEREVLHFVLVICSIMALMIILVVILWYVTCTRRLLWMLTIAQGYMATQEVSRLDQRP